LDEEAKSELSVFIGSCRDDGGRIYTLEVLTMGFMIVFFVINAFLGVVCVIFGIEPMAIYGKPERKTPEEKKEIPVQQRLSAYEEDTAEKHDIPIFPWK
jgi:hypothetical protein